MMSKSFVAALSCVAVLAPACGGGGDAERVIAVAEAWHRDVLAGDARAACALLTDRGERMLLAAAREDTSFYADELRSPQSCAELVVAARDTYSSEDRRMMRRMRIDRVRIDGDRAEIRDEDITYPSDLADEVILDDEPATFVRTRAGWKLEQLG